MRPIHVAVWGIGPHAERKILPAIAATDGLVLAGVCSRQPDRVSAATAAWGCRGWLDPDEMLADNGVDAVYVATPIGLHAEHGRRVIAAAKHLWCEKPLTMSAVDTAEILDRSREADRVVGEGLMFLHHAQFQELRRVLAEGQLGRLLAVTSRFGIPPLADPRFRNDRRLGGGALFDVGCYPVAALLALLPDADMNVAYARVRARDGAAVDTEGKAVIESAQGVVADLEWRINSAYRNELFLWGERGSVWTDLVFSKPSDHVPVLVVRDVHGTETRVSCAAEDHFVRMLTDFRAMILERKLAAVERARVMARAVLLGKIQQKAGW